MSIDGQFRAGRDLIVDLVGRTGHTVQRPDYTSSTSAETPVTASAIKMSCREGGDKYARPKITGAEYYSVFSKLRSIQAGDVILRSGFPALTVSNSDDDTMATIALRTDQICTLSRKRDVVVYSNVRFAYLKGASYYPSDVDMAGANDYQKRRAVIWTRTNVDTGMYLTDSLGVIWRIAAIDPQINILVLQLEEPES